MGGEPDEYARLGTGDTTTIVLVAEKGRSRSMEDQSRPVSVQTSQRRPGCLVTALWFIFIGWWLSGLWIAAAWILVVLIITMPIGLVMINKLPLIATLRPETTEMTVVAGRIQETSLEQRSMLLRSVYFLLIGWWWSFVWMEIAWLASLTIIGLPLAIWMYNRVPAITTLRRY